MCIIFCSPVLTMNNTEESILFYNYCKELIEQYVVDASFITNIHQINCLMASRIDEKSIVVFFNNEEGSYSKNCWNSYHYARNQLAEYGLLQWKIHHHVESLQ